MKKKSKVLSIILSVTLGPIGLLYSSIRAGLAAIIVLLFILMATIGVGVDQMFVLILFSFIVHPVIIAWGALIVEENNRISEVGMNNWTNIEIDQFYYAIQLYIFSLSICFVLFSLLDRFQQEHFMKSNLLLLSIITGLCLISFLLLTNKLRKIELPNNQNENQL